MLQLCDEPECPHCGCRDTQPFTPSRRRWSYSDDHAQRQQCNHCGKTWYLTKRWRPEAEPEPEPEKPKGVIYHVVRCPECGSKNTGVASTRRPERRHKCKDCGHAFKSIEE